MLTDQECKEIWESASKDNPIVVDSVEGKQVMAWLERFNKSRAKYNVNFEINSFTPFKSPIDGTMIVNRKQQTAHDHYHKVVQVGTEWDNDIKQKQQERFERGNV